MEKQKIEALVTRFNAGVASQTDLQELEQLIESGGLEIEDLQGKRNLARDLDALYRLEIRRVAGERRN